MATLQGETTLIFGVEIQAFDGRTSQFIHFNVLKVKLIKKAETTVQGVLRVVQLI